MEAGENLNPWIKCRNQNPMANGHLCQGRKFNIHLNRERKHQSQGLRLNSREAAEMKPGFGQPLAVQSPLNLADGGIFGIPLGPLCFSNKNLAISITTAACFGSRGQFGGDSRFPHRSVAGREVPATTSQFPASIWQPAIDVERIRALFLAASGRHVGMRSW